MVMIIYVLLAVVLAELAALEGKQLLDLWREGSGREKAAPEEPERDGEFEQKWQEGMSAMMGYDLSAARRAVRGDDDEDR